MIIAVLCILCILKNHSTIFVKNSISIHLSLLFHPIFQKIFKPLFHSTRSKVIHPEINWLFRGYKTLLILLQQTKGATPLETENTKKCEVQYVRIKMHPLPLASILNVLSKALLTKLNSAESSGKEKNKRSVVF